MNIKVDGGFEREDYRIFHFTKEEKRNKIAAENWHTLLSNELVEKIYNAKNFDVVQSDIRQRIGLSRPKNLDEINRKYTEWLNDIKLDTSDPQNYVIKLVLLAPPGFERLNPDDVDTILLNPTLTEKSFKNEVISGLLRLRYWEQTSVDAHELFHVHFYYTWRELFACEPPKMNFDPEILYLYELCEQYIDKSVSEKVNKLCLLK